MAASTPARDATAPSGALRFADETWGEGASSPWGGSHRREDGAGFEDEAECQK
jgi:hypothetical protein